MTDRTAPLYSPPARGLPRIAGKVLRALMFILAPALLIAGGVVALADIRTATSAPAAAVTLDAEEQMFLDLVNAYRSGQGLPTLAIDPQLQAASRWMSADMATNDYFSHYDSLGRDPFQRMDAFGYTYNVWKGENLAAGTAQAQVAFDLWKASPGHNSNMTNALFHGVGIARAYGPTSGLGWYWTTDFGGLANGDPPAEATASPAPTVAAVTPTPTPTLAPSPTQAPPPTPSGPKATGSPTPGTTQAPASLPTPTPTATPSPGPTPPDPVPALQGDMDCNALIDAKDALVLLRIVAGISGDTCSAASPDVNCNSLTDTGDALVILQYVADLPASTGPGCPRVGGAAS